MDSDLSFYKIITSSEKMDFPRGAAARIGGIQCDAAFLIDKGHHVWEVGVERDGDVFSFKKGWPQFYQENHLEYEDCVVFTYHGNNWFHFQLFGRDCLSKKTTGVEEDLGEFSDDDDEMEMEKGDDEEDETTSIGKTEQKPRLLLLSCEPFFSVRRKRPYKKQKVPNCYGHDIFESGLAIKPKNPYFVSRSRKSSRNQLYIPRDVIVDFKLEIPRSLFVVDGIGRKWDATIKKWKDGRLWCTRGWKSMCNVNNIGLDDTCICEFVQQEQGSLCLQIRVVDGDPHAGSK